MAMRALLLAAFLVVTVMSEGACTDSAQCVSEDVAEESALLAHAARAAERRAGLAANATEPPINCPSFPKMPYMTGADWTPVCEKFCGQNVQSTPWPNGNHGGDCWHCWCPGTTPGVNAPKAIPNDRYQEYVGEAYPGCCASNDDGNHDGCGSWFLKPAGSC